ncbi:glycosyltransferase [Myroides odoratimimus]|uniref:glycosyltransferase n=1 Tax=Myroides odoratimimus TaxID=76832 RepID=UPI0025771C11|nr:glycosyltransferase [Myroides odoratimimus]MDM1496782.1 glycosyltransferase [Myroides odoratimimus]MDM1530442.1 glycosyltransferase [Myroides odoratimimus]
MGVLRILHILGSLNRGGIETLLINLYRNVDRNVVQFDFLIHVNEIGDYGQEIIEYGGNIFHVKARNKGYFTNSKDLDSFFKKNQGKYSIVHYHCSSMSYIKPMLKAKKYGVENIILHSHNSRAGGFFIHNYLHKINRVLYRGFTNFNFACSDLAGKWMFGNSTYKIIKNGVDLDKFMFDGKVRNEYRKVLGFNEEDIVIGNVGRFHPQKNHLFLLDVFYELYNINKNYRLVLVGGGALEREIRDKIEFLDIGQRVTMLGVRNDVNLLINAFDNMLFPSLYEGLGIVLIEAQANGLPIYASENFIPKEVRINDNFNFVNLAFDAKVWAKIINKKKSERIDVNQTYESSFLKEYDINKVALDLQNFYLSLT